jgi:hypothetical protein
MRRQNMQLQGCSIYVSCVQKQIKNQYVHLNVLNSEPCFRVRPFIALLCVPNGQKRREREREREKKSTELLMQQSLSNERV